MYQTKISVGICCCILIHIFMMDAAGIFPGFSHSFILKV